MLLKSTKNANEGIFGPNSVVARVMAPRAVGLIGMRMLSMQVLYPPLAYALENNSSDSNSTYGNVAERIDRTATVVSKIIFGTAAEALSEGERLFRIHQNLPLIYLPQDFGNFRKGVAYSANDVDAILWVHTMIFDSYLKAYEAFYGRLSDREREQFYKETKRFAMIMGIPLDKLPKNWAANQKYIEKTKRNLLEVTPPAKKLILEKFIRNDKMDELFLERIQSTGRTKEQAQRVLNYVKIISIDGIPRKFSDELGLKCCGMPFLAAKKALVREILILEFARDPHGSLKPEFHEMLERSGKNLSDIGWIQSGAIRRRGIAAVCWHILKKLGIFRTK